MATTNKEELKTVKEEKTVIEYEEILIPRGSANDDPNLHVGFNGVNYILPRGKKSRVPTFVAEEIRRSWEAQAMADDRSAAMEEQAKGM